MQRVLNTFIMHFQMLRRERYVYILILASLSASKCQEEVKGMVGTSMKHNPKNVILKKHSTIIESIQSYKKKLDKIKEAFNSQNISKAFQRNSFYSGDYGLVEKRNNDVKSRFFPRNYLRDLCRTRARDLPDSFLDDTFDHLFEIHCTNASSGHDDSNIEITQLQLIPQIQLPQMPITQIQLPQLPQVPIPQMSLPPSMRPLGFPIFGNNDIWINWLQQFYIILKDTKMLKDYSIGAEMFHFVFQMIKDIKARSVHRATVDCPKVYFKTDRNLCLSTDFTKIFLDFEEARTFCQVIKGGDLVIFRDANEFADIQKYIEKIDPKRDFSYWIGITDAEKNQDWRFIDGRAVDMGAPYWGVSIDYQLPDFIDQSNDDFDFNKRMLFGVDVIKEARTTDEPQTNLLLEPEFYNEDDNYALLSNDDFHYIHSVDNFEAESYNTIPLCQYIPDRDRSNFQYGEAIWENFLEDSEWKGWDRDTSVEFSDWPTQNEGEIKYERSDHSSPLWKPKSDEIKTPKMEYIHGYPPPNWYPTLKSKILVS